MSPALQELVRLLAEKAVEKHLDEAGAGACDLDHRRHHYVDVLADAEPHANKGGTENAL